MHIAYTKIWPDITIYSNSAKKVILIELTCPWKENMEKLHDHKISKHLPLKSVIKSRGWEVDLYVIKVWARGFCSRSLLCCFRNLGLNNILAKKTLKTVSKLSMKSFLYVWRNVFWKSNGLNTPLTNITTPESHSPPIPKAKIKSNLPNSPTPSKSPDGFINKGNTSYANTILQALSVVPLLLRTSSAGSAQLSPLLKSIAINMAILLATINYSGSLNNRHYWAIRKDETTNKWFFCNDKVVFQIKLTTSTTKHQMCSFLWENNLVSFSFL